MTLGLLAGACEQGAGSDTGPRLLPLPEGSARVTIRDAQDRPVVGAAVTLDGLGRTVATRRSGRADLFGAPAGLQTLRIDGTVGSAADDSSAGTLALRVDLAANGEVPFEVFLPDGGQSAGLALTPGVQGGTPQLDDLGATGIRLQLAGATNIGTPDGGAVTLRTGALTEAQLPPGLPIAAPVLANQGAWIGPAGVTFAPAADLTVTNTGAWPAATVLDACKLDPDTGAWTVVGSATVDGGGATITAAGIVDTAGLYAFGATAAASASIQLRVLDVENAAAVPGVLVRAGSVVGRTSDLDGRVTLNDVAAVDGSGANRNLDVRVAGGRDWWPDAETANAALLPAAAVDLGSVFLDTFPAVDVRLLIVDRGFGFPRKNIGLTGNLRGLRSEVGITDADGIVEFTDAYRGGLGWYGGTPRDAVSWRISAGEVVLGLFEPRADVRSFTREEFWYRESGVTGMRVCDALTGGSLEGVPLAIGFTAGGGLIGPSNFNGISLVTFGAEGHVVGALQTASDGRTVTMAQSIVGPINERVEVPIQRAIRDPLGAFDRHGLLAGDITGAVGSGAFRLRTTRRITLRDWLHSVWLGENRLGSLPRRSDPDVTGLPEYEVGLAWPSGDLSVAEGAAPGGVFTWTRLGALRGLAVAEGARSGRDVPLDLAVDQNVTVPGALTGLDSGIAVADLRLDVAAAHGDTLVQDLVRDVGGNHTAVGQDLRLTLPATQGVLADTELLVSIRGSATAGGITTTQQGLLTLPGDAGGVPGLLAAPVITEPSPGTAIDPDGQVVRFTLPADALYGELKITSTAGSETNTWSVVVPQEQTEFTFLELPSELPRPLVSGRTWTLSLSAVRVRAGTQLGGATGLPYRQLVGRWYGMGLDEQQAIARTTVAIEVTTP